MLYCSRMNIWFSIIIAILSLVGFWIAEKIITMKKGDHPITCPIGFNCDEVIRGPHSKFLGIPVVNVGMWYFVFISAFFILNSIIPFSQNFIFITLLITGFALGFSAYLVGVQLFVIKKWCSWCLFTALIVFGIFTTAFIGYSEGLTDFLLDYRSILMVIFVAASIVGTFIATLYAYTFIKFLKDFKITSKESRRLTMYSQTTWVALGFVFLSGLGLVLSDVYREVTGASAFLVIGIVIGFLVFYELIQNTSISPKLVKIHFGDHPKLDDHEHDFQRKLALSFAIVGVVSWYLLLLFTNISWHEYMPITLVFWYLGAIILSVVVGLLFERIIYRQSRLQK